MRMPGLPFIAELGDGSRLSHGDEHRIETEPLGPAPTVRDPPLERAGTTLLASFGRQRDKLADIASSASLTRDPDELPQKPVDRVVPARAGRPNPGPAPEAVDLEARVLAEHP